MTWNILDDLSVKIKWVQIVKNEMLPWSVYPNVIHLVLLENI